ncbi:MAG: asparagine synthase (glutamine-hydrolyzing) [Ignavibacteriae bacterium]|nr:asparagine synthase (glutamine-hydrolyzing) [Ignavibacteriota bacterium]MCB9214729.1 asparagine synthase (glutamine-hydrolyzing) [Ignavibacteria bacterium]
MCGIVGIYNYSQRQGVVSQEVLQKMTSAIHHRGPDDDGIYVSENRSVGLGFRRLSIIDLSEAGHQPMSNPEKTIWITFNGEIYNHKELRHDLESKGYHYHSRTDTETILYAYQEYGLAFIEKLYGMFGIGIWDVRSEQLILIRDRLGVKPIYYTQQNGALYYASEIKALIEHPDISREMDNQGLYDYLSFYITPPDQTLFSGINKLEAGHYLIVDKQGTVEKKQYWDIPDQTKGYDPQDLTSEEFCVRELRQLLRDSIRLRMLADVPFGVLLSGGVDSSLNVALMSEQMDRPVQTFSVGFKNLENHNELEHARFVAERFQTNHHEALIDEDDAVDFLERMVWHQDEPNADPACVPMFFVSKLAREAGTIVVQVGEGADEEFSGYSHYQQELRYYNQFYKLPQIFHRMVYPIIRSLKGDQPITEYVRRSAERDTPFFYGAIPTFGEIQKRSLLHSASLQNLNSSSRVSLKYFQQLDSSAHGVQVDHLRRMIYYDMKNRLAELLLMRVDKMAMAVSVEARVPFLDHRIVEFAFRMPGNLKIKNGIGKYILKKAAEGIIPNETIYRSKQGLNSPIAEWMRKGSLATYTKDILNSSSLLKGSLFNEKYIQALYQKHVRGTANHSKQLWSLLILALWHKQYIER